MSTKLKAGTATSGAVIDADTSGILELVSGSSGQYTATIPQSSGTVMVSGNMPAFSAYLSGASQSFAANTWTKAQFQTEIFDTNNNFDSSTNYRFTPTVAGYYQVKSDLVVTQSSASFVVIGLYKNGSIYTRNDYNIFSTSSVTYTVSDLIYCNGTTDYIEVYIYCAGTSPVLQYASANQTCRFSGFLARAA